MLTFMIATALMIASPSAVWETSYGVGQVQAAAQKKPLVLVFAPGQNSWNKLIQEDSSEVRKLLSARYVCVHVDTSKPEGQKTAHDFSISTGVGLVISDRTGATQAFWHQGDLPNERIAHFLTKYADPNVVVSQTETIYSQRASMYPPMNFSPAPIRGGGC